MHKTLLFSCLLIWMGSFTFAQNRVLQLKETDQRSKTHDIGKKNAVVDFNSTVEIAVNKDSLRKKLEIINVNSPDLDEFFKKLGRLDTVLGSYLAFLEQYVEKANEWERLPGGSKELAAVETELSNIKRKAPLNLLRMAERGTSLRERINRALRQPDLSVTEQYQAVFEAALEEKDELQKEIDAVLNREGVVIQMGAWIITADGTRELRLEGFGDVAKGSYYEVGRHQLSLTPEQQEELKRYETIFSEKIESISDIIDDLKQPYKDFYHNILDTLEYSIEKIAVQLDTALNRIKDSDMSIFTSVDNFKEEWKNYKEYIKDEKMRYISGGEEASSAALLLSLEGAFRTLWSRTKDIARIDLTLKDAIENQINDPTIELEANALLDSLKASRRHFAFVENYAKGIKAYWKDISFTINGRKVMEETLTFSKDVYKLGFGAVPEATSFDLLYSGNREANDMVVIKLAAARDTLSEPIELEKHTLRLMNALPHLELSVAYSFAHPTDEDEFGDSWRGGPIYSMLLKFGSRNKNYRTFVDFGIGLNFAAYDFDGDGTPEISTGFGASAFRDYWQGGIGYNFNAGSWYYFAGLRIPIPIVPIGNGRSKEGTAASF